MQGRKIIILFLGMLAAAFMVSACGDGDDPAAPAATTPPEQPDECIDNEGDGFGDPASELCKFPQEDCNDDTSNDPPGCEECVCLFPECAACAFCIHPAGRDYPDDEVDTDCDPETDVYWSNSSIMKVEKPYSETLNYFALLLLPAAFALILKRRNRRK